MPDLKIDVTKFAGAYALLNAKKQLRVTEEQALHAAMTLGTPLLKKGVESTKHALAMAAYKAVAIKATIDFSQKELCGFKAYRQLDPSEKTNLSYWIGMVFTSMLARDLIGVEQLLHTACLNPRRIVKTNKRSKSLADLIGRDASGNWHVLEAKGRQIQASQRDRNKWKTQSCTISMIGGKVPITRSFCVAMVGSIYRAEWEDPDDERGSVEINFGRIGEDQTLIDTYYGPLLDVLRQSSISVTRGDLDFILTRVAFDAVTNKHVFAGMQGKVYKMVDSLGHLPTNMEPIYGTDFYHGSDGIVILTSETCVPESE